MNTAPLPLPTAVAAALRAGAPLALSISGGKDSQAMLDSLARHPDRHLWPGRLLCLHADLGRMEWPQTEREVREQVARYGLPLEIVRRPRGDLLSRMHDEMIRTAAAGAPFWPTATKRYCTAEMKRDQLIKVQRRLGPLVVCAQGIRAEESPGRARRSPLTIEKRLTASRLAAMTPDEALDARRPDERLVLNWLPIHEFDEAAVWRACGTSIEELARRRMLYRIATAGRDRALRARALAGWPAHLAYIYGTSRLSCALCVLASKDDIGIGALHNPGLYCTLAAMELATGFGFQPRVGLAVHAPVSAAPDVSDKPLDLVGFGRHLAA